MYHFLVGIADKCLQDSLYNSRLTVGLRQLWSLVSQMHCGMTILSLPVLSINYPTFRDMFHPNYTAEELPAHVYLRSVHNISIERSWLRLRLEFGSTAVMRFREGLVEVGGPYNPTDPCH